MPAHVGIVACGSERLGRHAHPEVSLHSHCLAEYMEAIRRDDWQGVARLMLSSARKLHVLGTRYTMEGPIYPEKLGAVGLDQRAPNPGERDRLDRIIMDELVYGRFTEESLAAFQAVIRRLGREEGCDAVVLGCTEIPLLVTPDRSPLPTLDSTRLLAMAAVDHAI